MRSARVRGGRTAGQMTSGERHAGPAGRSSRSLYPRPGGTDDWAAPTRCADWSAHDVVRRPCDCNGVGIAAGADDGTLDISAGFDPRITPRMWLTASAGEPPDVNLTRFVATSDELLTLARDRLTQNRRFDVRLPYGPMDWTVRMLHGFWDSWIHERDVLLAQGTGHRPPGFPGRVGAERSPENRSPFHIGPCRTVDYRPAPAPQAPPVT